MYGGIATKQQRVKEENRQSDTCHSEHPEIRVAITTTVPRPHLDQAGVNWPPVNRRPLHGGLPHLVDMAIDSIEAGASSGARVLRILSESYSMLHAIPATRENQ